MQHHMFVCVRRGRGVIRHFHSFNRLYINGCLFSLRMSPGKAIVICYLICGESETHYHQSKSIMQREQCLCLRRYLSLGKRTDLKIFPLSARNGILDAYVQTYASAVGDNFILEDDENARSYGPRIVDDYFL